MTKIRHIFAKRLVSAWRKIFVIDKINRWFVFTQDLIQKTTLLKKSLVSHWEIREALSILPAGLLPFFSATPTVTSIVDLCRPTFERKLTSSINDRAKATAVAIPT